MFDDLPALERKVADLKAKSERAKGRLAEIASQLKKKFGCKTLKEAKRKLREKEDQERAEAEMYAKAKKTFEKRYAHLLEKL